MRWSTLADEMATTVRIARRDASGAPVADEIWAPLQGRLGGLAHEAHDRSLLVVVEAAHGGAVATIEHALDLEAPLAGWRERYVVQILSA